MLVLGDSMSRTQQETSMLHAVIAQLPYAHLPFDIDMASILCQLALQIGHLDASLLDAVIVRLLTAEQDTEEQRKVFMNFIYAWI